LDEFIFYFINITMNTVNKYIYNIKSKKTKRVDSLRKLGDNEVMIFDVVNNFPIGEMIATKYVAALKTPHVFKITERENEIELEDGIESAIYIHDYIKTRAQLRASVIAILHTLYMMKKKLKFISGSLDRNNLFIKKYNGKNQAVIKHKKYIFNINKQKPCKKAIPEYIGILKFLLVEYMCHGLVDILCPGGLSEDEILDKFFHKDFSKHPGKGTSILSLKSV